MKWTNSYRSFGLKTKRSTGLKTIEHKHLTPLWEDTDTRTVSQAVDALGKASKMLGVPQEELWDMIPGVTKTRADSWRAWKENHPDADALAVQAYASQLAPATTGGDDGLDR